MQVFKRKVLTAKQTGGINVDNILNVVNGPAVAKAMAGKVVNVNLGPGP
ncbi:MAG: hypothetical protein Q7U74_08415 [Saprospiraceae bacterium]|nr:hypothetical protein [Saprospiraceae bacterium]